MAKHILLSEFQAEPERWLDELRQNREPIQLMVGDEAVATLGPPEDQPQVEAPLMRYGAMKGTVIILGDIVAPLDEAWDALA